MKYDSISEWKEISTPHALIWHLYAWEALHGTISTGTQQNDINACVVCQELIILPGAWVWSLDTLFNLSPIYNFIYQNLIPRKVMSSNIISCNFIYNFAGILKSWEFYRLCPSAGKSKVFTLLVLLDIFCCKRLHRSNQCSNQLQFDGPLHLIKIFFVDTSVIPEPIFVNKLHLILKKIIMHQFSKMCSQPLKDVSLFWYHILLFFKDLILLL